MRSLHVASRKDVLGFNSSVVNVSEHKNQKNNDLKKKKSNPDFVKGHSGEVMKSWQECLWAGVESDEKLGPGCGRSDEMDL